MAIDTSNKYVTTSGLGQFLSKIKEKYASNSATTYKVNHAISADNDANGNEITKTYYTIADFNTFKSGYDTFYKDTTAFNYDKIWSIRLKGNPNDATYGSGFTELTPDKTNRRIDIDLSAYALLTDITAVLQFKGTLNQYTDLPTTNGTTVNGITYNVKIGDVYLLKQGLTYDSAEDDEPVHTDYNVEYACVAIDSSTKAITWEKIGSSYDFSAYAEKTWVEKKIEKSESGTSDTITKLTDRVKTNEDKLTTLNGDINTNGSVIKTATDITTTKINALNYTYSGTAGELVTDVSESAGIISVTKGSLSIATENDISSLFN